MSESCERLLRSTYCSLDDRFIALVPSKVADCLCQTHSEESMKEETLTESSLSLCLNHGNMVDLHVYDRSSYKQSTGRTIVGVRRSKICFASYLGRYQRRKWEEGGKKNVNTVFKLICPVLQVRATISGHRHEAGRGSAQRTRMLSPTRVIQS